jgi:hypothetical protein
MSLYLWLRASRVKGARKIPDAAILFWTGLARKDFWSDQFSQAAYIPSKLTEGLMRALPSA